MWFRRKNRHRAAPGTEHRKVKTEYHRIAICSMRTRPKRPASAPVNQPPNAEVATVDGTDRVGGTGRQAPYLMTVGTM
jgi:hypothetical protein